MAMNERPLGLGIEVQELGLVGMFLAALYPAYKWVSKADSQNSMYTRSALVGTGLLGLALYSGFRDRK